MARKCEAFIKGLFEDLMDLAEESEFLTTRHTMMTDVESGVIKTSKSECPGVTNKDRFFHSAQCM